MFSQDETPSTDESNDSTSENDDKTDIHSFFTKMLSQEDCLKAINVPVAANPGEIILMILKFSITNNLSYTAVKNLFVLINSIFAEPILPETRYLIEKLITSIDNATCHFTCDSCSSVITFALNKDDKQPIKCNNCETFFSRGSIQNRESFVLWDVSQEIREKLEDNAEYYNYVVRHRQSEDGVFTSIYDRRCYKQFVNSLDECDRENYIS